MPVMTALLFVLFFVAVPAFGASRPLEFHSLQEYEYAKCLDGSAAGYYFDASPSGSTSWIIYMEWGGWCYELDDCIQRSTTSFGSSSQWSTSKTVKYGPMSDNPTTNPTFSSFNRVYIPYCDGGSFSGNRKGIVNHKGTELHFKGNLILESVFVSLQNETQFKKATSVILSGSSAGGLSTLLHADTISESWLPSSVTTYKALVDSGYFLDHVNLNGKAIFKLQMYGMVRMQNSTLPSRCLAQKSEEDWWKCIFAAEIYKTLETEIFLLNSLYDLYQTQCILTEEFVSLNNTAHNCSAIPGWYNCTQRMDSCSTNQIAVLNSYSEELLQSMKGAATWTKNGNGAFLYSCYSHKAMTYPGNWNIISINGVTMEQAVSNWWNGNEDSPISLPCQFQTKKPYNCNPTCWATIISKV